MMHFLKKIGMGLTSLIFVLMQLPTAVAAETIKTSGEPELLPDTGPLMWLVYVFAAIGLAALITVWGFHRSASVAKKFRITVLILGCCFLGGAVWIMVDGYVTEKASTVVMTAALDEIKSVLPKTQEKPEEPEVPDPFEEEMKEYETEEEPVMAPLLTIEVDGIRYIGILTVPSLSLELPIAADCSMKTLNKTPGCYDGMSPSTDLVIGAHNFASHFGSLRKLADDSEVIFTDISGTVYRYRVVEVTELLPTQVDAVRESEHALVLFTCNSSGARRIVVYCDYVE